MKDINDFRFSGIIERFDRIQTRTGTPMVSFLVQCWKERVRVVAFRDLAEQTTLAAGDRVEVVGRVQGTEWQDKDGNKRSGWQVIADEIRRTDDTDTRQRAAAVVACCEWAKLGTNQHGGSEPGSYPPTCQEMAKAADVSVKTIQVEQPRPPARQQQAHQGNLFPERRPDTGAQYKYTDGPF